MVVDLDEAYKEAAYRKLPRNGPSRIFDGTWTAYATKMLHVKIPCGGVVIPTIVILEIEAKNNNLLDGIERVSCEGGPKLAWPETRVARNSRGPKLAWPETRVARNSRGPKLAWPETRVARNSRGRLLPVLRPARQSVLLASFAATRTTARGSIASSRNHDGEQANATRQLVDRLRAEVNAHNMTPIRTWISTTAFVVPPELARPSSAEEENRRHARAPPERCDPHTSWGPHIATERTWKNGCRHLDTSALPDEDRAVWERERDRIVTDDGRSINLGWNVVAEEFDVFSREQVRRVTDAHAKYLISDKITRVNLAGCQGITDDALKEISANCSNLTSLNVSGCGKLTDDALEAISANCSNLTYLDVVNCENLTDDALEAIAANCSDLTNLSVSVSECKELTDDALEAIAAKCSSKLTVLHASNCNFTSLPKDIGDQMPELQTLDLFGTNLTALPRSIVKLTKLEELYLYGNPLKTPPFEVADQGLQDIARFFAELDLAGAAVSTELMVVLVGDGKAGKTSLRNAIAGRANPRQAPDDRTLYLDCTLTSKKLRLAISFSLSATWALFFITPSALYLLVVPVDKANDKNFQDAVGRFLVPLQAQAPGAVVQLVITKTDLPDYDESACKKWLHDAVNKELNGWREAVAKKRNVSPDDVQLLNAVIDAARASIVELKTLFPSVGQTIPRSWLAVWGLLSEIARHGDDDRAVAAARGNAVIGEGIVFLQPSFLVNIMKALIAARGLEADIDTRREALQSLSKQRDFPSECARSWW
ncbi:hypothetical protein CTAYLR_004557 [Chrysophaeum taylorii]|uniref:Uncharacterized protein n=1 Tax=Chrysophaeum taylorii TaxID=2483200 RepID=A0AAD7UIC5_9STRA|nr:hypothetical protein CTAYLR_004557 [Chrysophaeum taylorii]